MKHYSSFAVTTMNCLTDTGYVCLKSLFMCFYGIKSSISGMYFVLMFSDCDVLTDFDSC